MKQPAGRNSIREAIRQEVRIWELRAQELEKEEETATANKPDGDSESQMEAMRHLDQLQYERMCVNVALTAVTRMADRVAGELGDPVPERPKAAELGVGLSTRPIFDRPQA